MDALQIFRYSRPRPELHARPVFLLGHPKSGTTIIAKLLAGISGESLTDDLFRNGTIKRTEIQLLFEGRLALREFVDRYPHQFATRINKSPKLTYFDDDLSDCFPQARFVYIVRDPRAALRSFLGWRVIPGNAESLTDPVQRRRVEVLPRQPDGHYVARLAQRWNQAADVYLQHEAKFKLIRYENFLVDPARAIQDLASAVGLERRHDIAAPLDFAYKSSGFRHIAYANFFGAPNLERIESICADRMHAFGYA